MARSAAANIVDRWLYAYNTDVHGLIDDLYADDFVAEIPGRYSCTNKEDLHSVEAVVLSTAPDRRAELRNLLECGGTAILECVLHWTDLSTGDPCQSCFCVVLDFVDGRVVSDRTYIDALSWPGINTVLQR